MKTLNPTTLRKALCLLKKPQSNVEKYVTLQSVAKTLDLTVTAQGIEYYKKGVNHPFAIFLSDIHRTLVRKGVLRVYLTTGDLYLWNLQDKSLRIKPECKEKFLDNYAEYMSSQPQKAYMRDWENGGVPAGTIVHKAGSRGYGEHAGIKIHSTFSFDNYPDQERISFGELCVLNDCAMAPGKGSKREYRINKEIILIPLKGILRHWDTGNEAYSILAPGHIQVMSAGGLLFHHESNESKTQEAQYLEIWVFPQVKGMPSASHSYDTGKLLKKNHLACIIAPDGSAPASIRQKAWLFMGKFDAGEETGYKRHAGGNGVYVFVIEGEAEILGEHLGRRDGMGIRGTEEFRINVTREACILLMEVPM